MQLIINATTDSCSSPPFVFPVLLSVGTYYALLTTHEDLTLALN